MSLLEEIKKEIGYTVEPVPSCINCKYRRESENSYIDRMWDNTCHIVESVVILDVEKNGRCNKFEPLTDR
jgi:hypothetical protein